MDRSTLRVRRQEGQKIQAYPSNIKKAEGVHALWLRFYGKPGDVLKIDSTEFK